MDTYRISKRHIDNEAITHLGIWIATRIVYGTEVKEITQGWKCAMKSRWRMKPWDVDNKMNWKPYVNLLSWHHL